MSFFLLEPGREDKNSPIKYIGAVQKAVQKLKMSLTFEKSGAIILEYAAQRGKRFRKETPKLASNEHIGGAFLCTRLLQQAESSTR